MSTRSKAWLTRVTGNLSLLAGVVSFLAVIATPDDGPFPSTRIILLTILFVTTPLCIIGVWLKHKSKLLTERSEMDYYIGTLD